MNCIICEEQLKQGARTLKKHIKIFDKTYLCEDCIKIAEIPYKSKKIIWEPDCYTLHLIFVADKKIFKHQMVVRKEKELFFLFDMTRMCSKQALGELAQSIKFYENKTPLIIKNPDFFNLQIQVVKNPQDVHNLVLLMEVPVGGGCQ